MRIASAALAWFLAGSSSIARGQVPSVNYVIGVQGKVEVQRPGWTRYAPVTFGMPLGREDLLRLGETATVTVACADLQIKVVARLSFSGIPCPSTNPILYWKGSVMNVTRTPQFRAPFPAIISPRMTKVLDSNLVIRWTPVPNATSYVVSMEPGPIWSAVVNARTELRYPKDAPRLEENKTYIVRVAVAQPEQLRRLTSDEATAGLGFTIIVSQLGNQVHLAERTIGGLPITSEAKRLIMATLYATNGLRSDALNLLEQPANKVTAPNMLFMAGELYRETGLYGLASANYLAAMKSAGESDPDLRARALDSLALVYEMTGDIPEAKKQGDAALKAFDALGDRPTVVRIAAFLARLSAQ